MSVYQNTTCIQHNDEWTGQNDDLAKEKAVVYKTMSSKPVIKMTACDMIVNVHITIPLAHKHNYINTGYSDELSQ